MLRFLTSTWHAAISGRSLYTGQPVASVIGEQIPYTAQLALAGLAGGACSRPAARAPARSAKTSGGAPRWLRASPGLAMALPVAFGGVLAILWLFVWSRAAALRRCFCGVSVSRRSFSGSHHAGPLPGSCGQGCRRR